MQIKMCARCKQELPIEQFYIDKYGRANSYCKQCDKERKKNKKPVEPPKDLSFYKICSCCGQKKLAKEFNKHKWRKDGLSTQCKQCDSVKQAEYIKRYENNKIPETKRCLMCGETKPASEFSSHNRSFDKLNSYCKDCCKKFTTDRIKYAEEHRINITQDYTKVCNICKQSKPASEFYKSSYNLDGLQYTCKDCEKREERKIYNKKYGKQVITKHCVICGKEFKAARSASNRCLDCRRHTLPENLFIDILNKYSIEYDTEYRVNSLNVWCDFYLPKYDIFIDISPTVTHSTIGKKDVFEAKPKDYHINRRLQVNNEGYKYINIWDWDKPENIVKAILKDNLIIRKQDTPNIVWCKNNLKSCDWGNYPSNIYKLNDNTVDEKQMIAEGYIPVYDDGQILIY